MSQERSPEDRRFERIEAAHETLAKALAAFASDSHTAFAALNISQQHRMEEIQRIVAQLGKRDTDVHALFELKKDQDKKLNALTSFMTELAISQTAAELQIGKIAGAQVKLTESQTKLTESQATTEQHINELSVKSAETQGKFDALIDMWDKMIRERGGKNGNPAPEPPPA